MRMLLALLFLLVALLPYALIQLVEAPTTEPPANAGLPVSGALRILSAHNRETAQEYTRAYAAWRAERGEGPVTLEWLDVGGTSRMLKDLESRFATNPAAPGVDLLFGGGVDPYLKAAELGWLDPTPLPPELLATIPPTCGGVPTYDPAGMWYGVAISGFGILVSLPVVERLELPMPRRWQDLGEPAWYGWVGSGDPGYSGSVHMGYEIILQALGYEAGWRLITRISANVRRFGESGGTVPREVADGEIAAGMVISQYAHTVIRSLGEDRLALLLPEGLTLVGPDAIARLKHASAPELATDFIAFTLSESGQRLLYQPAGMNGQRRCLYRMPVRRELYADPAAPRPDPFSLPVGFHYDGGRASLRWRILNDLIGATLIEPHAELRAAWGRLIKRGPRPAEVARLTAPIVGEAELEALAARWSEPSFRLETLRAWGESARTRYRDL